MIGLFIHTSTLPPNTNKIFDPTTRDGLSEPWIALRNEFFNKGIKLITKDEWTDQNVDFEFHINVQRKITEKLAFMVTTENDFTHPLNQRKFHLQKYKKVFSWSNDLVERGLATKIQLAYPLREGVIDGYSNRSQLVVLIAANKALPVLNLHNDLYSERVKAIRWFERNAPNEFALYGYDWDKSPKLPTKLGKVVHLIEKHLPWRPKWFPSWQGSLAAKQHVLEKSRFSIVYENVRGLRGYITEKIFDAFCAGNVPVYWGADNIFDYVPKHCFIDRKAFSSYDKLYEFLVKMPEKDYIGYQSAIKEFLASESAQAFSTKKFAVTIVNEVISSIVKS
jgi:hypothetical protein